MSLGLVVACAGRSAPEPEVASPQPESAQAAKQMSKDQACKRAGCSRELCVSVGSEITKSPCIWQAYFACYDGAECTLQPDGRCGWTDTDELRQCIEEAASEGGAVRAK